MSGSGRALGDWPITDICYIYAIYFIAKDQSKLHNWPLELGAEVAALHLLVFAGIICWSPFFSFYFVLVAFGIFRVFACLCLLVDALR